MADNFSLRMLADMANTPDDENLAVSRMTAEIPQQMPQNWVQRGNDAPIDLGPSQGIGSQQGPALDYSRPPVSYGGQKGYYVKGDPFTVVMQDGTRLSLGNDQAATRKRTLEELQMAKARQELAHGDTDNQLKRAQLMELMGQDPSQMMPQGMPATGGQAPRVAAPVIQQGQPASSSGDADPMLLALRQKFLQRRFGNPPPGERWDEQGRAIPIPGHQKDLGEGQKKQVLGVQNLSDAIDEYRAELAGWSGVDALSPDKRAGMGVKYNNMMLQAKEAYNLGVLNGPDFAILTSMITDPRSLTGAITSNEAMDKQASELKRIMQKVGANVSNSRPSVPSQDAPQKAKTVVRTGTANGRKVVQYSDGSVDYAP